MVWNKHAQGINSTGVPCFFHDQSSSLVQLIE